MPTFLYKLVYQVVAVLQQGLVQRRVQVRPRRAVFVLRVARPRKHLPQGLANPMTLRNCSEPSFSMSPVAHPAKTCRRGVQLIHE